MRNRGCGAAHNITRNSLESTSRNASFLGHKIARAPSFVPGGDANGERGSRGSRVRPERVGCDCIWLFDLDDALEAPLFARIPLVSLRENALPLHVILEPTRSSVLNKY
jgi:hypothetical protein